ncbi:hypothetical protein BH24ACT9_BH24ACT9_12820 [soil metagenome]
MTHPRHRSRDYDLVIFGATGFTGGLTADYLARHAPSGMRWAIAGRDPSRLRRVAQRLAELSPSGHPVGTIRADSQDAGALRSLAESSRVVASTVGPFMTHGSALVVACVQQGPTTSTSPANRSSSTGSGWTITTPRPELERDWSTRAASTPYRTTSVCGSPCITFPSTKHCPSPGTSGRTQPSPPAPTIRHCAPSDGHVKVRRSLVADVNGRGGPASVGWGRSPHDRIACRARPYPGQPHGWLRPAALIGGPCRYRPSTRS